MGRIFVVFLAFLGFWLSSAICLAQEASMTLLATAPAVAPDTLQTIMDDFAWLQELMKIYGSLGGFVTWQAKAIAVIFLIIGSLKVSALSWVWEKFGSYKSLVAPFLALLAAIFQCWSSGPFSWTTLFIAVTTGAGALAFADLMKTLKLTPGVGKVPLAVIMLLEKLLGKKNDSSDTVPKA